VEGTLQDYIPGAPEAVLDGDELDTSIAYVRFNNNNNEKYISVLFPTTSPDNTHLYGFWVRNYEYWNFNWSDINKVLCVDLRVYGEGATVDMILGTTNGSTEEII